MFRTTDSRLLAPVAAALSALALLGAAGAQTINWGNEVSLGDVHYDSWGNQLDATYTYSFGVFDVGFDPVVEDPDTWFDNWTSLDSSTYNEGASFFSGSWVPEDNTYEGRQAYIWVYNHTDSTDQTTEWVLITDSDGLDGDDWTIPTMDDQSALPLEWRVSEATTPIFGGLESTQGAGEYDVDPGTFELQTHTFAPPIPEPGVAILLVGGALLGCRRRSRER